MRAVILILRLLVLAVPGLRSRANLGPLPMDFYRRIRKLRALRHDVFLLATPKETSHHPSAKQGAAEPTESRRHLHGHLPLRLPGPIPSARSRQNVHHDKPHPKQNILRHRGVPNGALRLRGRDRVHIDAQTPGAGERSEPIRPRNR